MVSRPYMSFRIDALEELFKTSSDPEILQDLHIELSFRTTSRSKKLLALVDSKLGTQSSPNADVAILQIEFEDFQKRYRALRETFTLEGEVLARWGMSGSIPREIEKEVFSLWAQLVNIEEDKFGRSVLSLRRDLKVLSDERVGMSPGVLSEFEFEE